MRRPYGKPEAGGGYIKGRDRAEVFEAVRHARKA